MRKSAPALFFPLALLLSWYPALWHLAGVERAYGMNPLGVLVAALICGAIEGGGAAKRLLRSMVRVKVPAVCHAVAPLFPPLLLGASAAIAVVSGAAQPDAARLGNWPQIGEWIYAASWAIAGGVFAVVMGTRPEPAIATASAR